MERVPFFRRTLWIFILGLSAVALPYSLLFLRAAPSSLPGSLLILVPILGAVVAMGCLALSLMIIMRIQGMRASLPVLLRTVLVSFWLLAHLVYLTEDQRYFTLQLVVFDLDLLALALIFSLLIAAQFVLPVETGADRLLAIRRLVGYALGERGPVTFIEEGQVRQAYAEDRRPGPGVFLIDNTSAVVLRTDTAFTRAMGPGVVFSKPGERCAEALDLRPQIRRLAGSSQVENTPEGEVTSNAVTQDGISIGAEIAITFILDPGFEGSPRLGRLADKPPYEFNRASAERAVYAHTFGELDDVPWTSLPELLVADVWREEVKSWPLDKLLSPTTDERPPLEQIAGILRQRLIPPLRKDFQREAAAPETSSRELEILRARGIRILDLTIANLQLPEPVQEERSLRWRESWSAEVQEALHESKDRLKQIRDKAERDAELAFLESFGRSLLDELRANKLPGKRETLLALLADVLQPATSPDIPAIDAQLREQLLRMQAELRKLTNDCQEHQG